MYYCEVEGKDGINLDVGLIRKSTKNSRVGKRSCIYPLKENQVFTNRYLNGLVLPRKKLSSFYASEICIYKQAYHRSKYRENSTSSNIYTQSTS